VKTGVQGIINKLKTLDSGFRRNDKNRAKETIYETIKFWIGLKFGYYSLAFDMRFIIFNSSNSRARNSQSWVSCLTSSLVCLWVWTVS